MTQPINAVCGLVLALVRALPVGAQSPSNDSLSLYEGLYRPAGEHGAGWSCSPEFIRMDGGALAVLDGYLEGVENRCALTDPQSLNDGGTQFFATCSAEGETYTEPVILRRTENGISVTRGASTVEWASCGPSGTQDGAAARQPSNGPWIEGFAQGVSEIWSEDASGNRITFSCSGGYDGGLYIELDGRPAPGGSIVIDIDGQSYAMSVWADGGAVNTESRVGADNFETLWTAAANGNRLTVTATSGLTAHFHLDGTNELLGEVPYFAVGNSG